MTSITKKLVLSLSGLFLILFLALHMSVNLIAVFSFEAYNEACEFMGTNPIVQIMVPVLALGFIVHIIFAFIVTWQNKKARGEQGFESKSATDTSWVSKNMLVLGIIVFVGLLVHLSQFWSKMQLQEWKGVESANGADVLVATFSKLFNVLLYIVWILALGFHLIHGFWSAFQSLGVNKPGLAKRIKIFTHSFVTFLLLGFITTVVYVYIYSFRL